MAGRVESVGSNVEQFQPGDEVFGETATGNQWHNAGAFAEYVSVAEEALALKPANLTFEQAAAVPTSALIALENLRDRIQPGQKVLINGAGGGLGTFAVQLAKSYGADVTGVDSAGKLDMVRSIGADHVIDYIQEDFTQSGERYDLILDIPGNHSMSELRRALTPEGTYVLIGHDLFGASGGRFLGSGIPRFLKLLVSSPFVSQDMGLRFPKGTKEHLVALKELLEAGKVTPVIDRTYPLSEVAEAIRYLEAGQASGKIVITVWDPDHGSDQGR
ncbi:MAG: NAD(P)-dependent alcohol dehydrogenase [Acidimicrobiia bacterium]